MSDNRKILICGLVAIALFALVYQGTSLYFHKTADLSSQTSATFGENLSDTGFGPGPTPKFSCQLLNSQPGYIVISNVTGMSAFTVNGVADYLITPGSTGQITYYVHGSAIAVRPMENITAPAPAKTSLAPAYNPEIAFYHQVQESANYTATVANSPAGWRHATSAAQSPGAAAGSGYMVCFGSNDTGSICRYSSSLPSAGSITFNATSYDHTGINASYVEPAPTNSETETISISAAYGAGRGTYWVTIGGGPCNGGEVVLLTVGNAPYSGSVKPDFYV